LKKRDSESLFSGYEKTGYDDHLPSRITEVLPHGTARRLVEAGVHCVKALLDYSYYERAKITDIKHARRQAVL
jgi:tagatose-1,6-bisphosphate aldolase